MPAQGSSEPLVEVLRGSLVDERHGGALAVVDATGSVYASVGDPRATIAYWRSSAKPFQAMPVVSSGAAARWSLTGEDLALISGSHNGEPVHTAGVAALLERVGCAPHDLVCGIHPPLDPAAAGALQHAGAEPGILHNNCAGNHAGMVALSRQLGASPEGYELPGHPAQVEILATVSRFTGLPAPHIAIGIDGCGVPCFGISVYHMALAFARLAAPDDIAEPYASAARAVRDAMLAHPYLVAGRGRLDTDLMRSGAGALVAKGGAGGVQCVGIAGGLGLALKLEDGASGPSPARPGSVATIEALRQLRVLDEAQMAALAEHARPAIRTLLGRAVGTARPAFRLELADGGRP